MPTARDLDAADPLARFADQFAKPPGTVYLDGNSLGLLCKPAEESLWTAVEMWQDLAIRGWTERPEPWFDLSRKVAGQLAPLLGADAEDVMVGQSTTANLHQLLATFYNLIGDRRRILIDGAAFPSGRDPAGGPPPRRAPDPRPPGRRQALPGAAVPRRRPRLPPAGHVATRPGPAQYLVRRVRTGDRRTRRLAPNPLLPLPPGPRCPRHLT